MRAYLTIAVIKAGVMDMMGWFMDICLMGLLLPETMSTGRLLSPIGLHQILVLLIGVISS